MNMVFTNWCSWSYSQHERKIGEELWEIHGSYCGSWTSSENAGMRLLDLDWKRRKTLKILITRGWELYSQDQKETSVWASSSGSILAQWSTVSISLIWWMPFPSLWLMWLHIMFLYNFIITSERFQSSFTSLSQWSAIVEVHKLSYAKPLVDDCSTRRYCITITQTPNPQLHDMKFRLKHTELGKC